MTNLIATTTAALLALPRATFRALPAPVVAAIVAEVASIVADIPVPAFAVANLTADAYAAVRSRRQRIDVIDLFNNSNFLNYIRGFFIFAATDFAASGVARVTGMKVYRIGRLADGRVVWAAKSAREGIRIAA